MINSVTIEYKHQSGPIFMQLCELKLMGVCVKLYKKGRMCKKNPSLARLRISTRWYPIGHILAFYACAASSLSDVRIEICSVKRNG
jgi:hypothetical protein